MRCFPLSIVFSTIFFSRLGLTTSDYTLPPRCRCLPSSPCWPKLSEWDSFNSSVFGALVAVRPVASPCHDPTFNEAACEDVKKNFGSSSWRSSFPGSYMQVNFETSAFANQTCYTTTPQSSPCGQGNVPVYAVAVTSAEQIQKTVVFARERNLRLVIKNSGHDYLGRSAGRGALEIWTHNMKSLVWSKDFVPEKCQSRYGEEAVTIGAGMQIQDIYGAAAEKGKALVIGLADTVGAAGGYILGGGHSPLGPWKGMASDNALQFTVVTADGQHVTANDCQNSDLFWALRGGGGSFGVVTSVTIRTFPDVPMTTQAINITISNTEDFWSMITEFHEFVPAIDDANGSGYYWVFSETNAFIMAGFFVGKSNTTAIEQLFQPFLEKAKGYNGTVGSETLPAVNTSLAFFTLLSGPNPNRVGSQVLLASRLISRKFLESDDGPERLTQVFRELSPNQETVFLGHIVAGGQVAKNKGVVDSAINPSWRKALVHLVFARGWGNSASFEEQAEIARNMTDVEIPVLAALEPDMGAYINEADPNERNWQQVFWGENYKTLLETKEKWDRKGLFICKPCVGSEDWDKESICKIK